MRKVFLLFLLFSVCTFSQKKDYSFYFDYFSKVSSKIYGNVINEDAYIFKNSKDSTYFLELRYSKTDTIAQIHIKNKNDIIKFKIDFKYEKISDLNKLKDPILYETVIPGSPKKYKNFHEVMEHEIDSINDQVLVHITQYKNKKKNKIINEHYYYFSKKDNIEPVEIPIFKNNLISKYKLDILVNYNFEKQLCLIDDKLSSEFTIQKIEKISSNLNFTVIKTIR
ncbi:hypothetical protein [Flavobacterium facile]|uniref:hypothetical protein n=1 Tax=Flavobacterium facile TaxID=2893174 RepID=UPI002E766755|nr:hypothetical protein [Flavobacterium sp. T-12]